MLKAIRGRDGKLLGLTFDDNRSLSREDYSDFDQFMIAFAALCHTRIPNDTESPHAIEMIERDAERLDALHAN